MIMTIKATNGQWVVIHTGSGSQELTDRMGTDTLPTPFSTLIPGVEVLDQIIKLNPDHRVILEVSP